MNEYRDKLKLQNLFIAACSFTVAAVAFLFAATEAGWIDLMPKTDDAHLSDAWLGVICGMCCSFLGFMIGFLIRNIRALTNDAFLKKLYVKDNDERQILIWTNARAVSMQVFLILGVVAGVIAGFFNMTVSITIFACVTIHSFLGLGLAMYFNIKL